MLTRLTVVSQNIKLGVSKTIMGQTLELYNKTLLINTFYRLLIWMEIYLQFVTQDKMKMFSQKTIMTKETVFRKANI